MFFDRALFPSGLRGANLRMLAAQRRGEEGRYSMNRYLQARGDAKFKNTADMFTTPTFAGHMDVLKAAFGLTAKTLDRPPQTHHLLRIQAQGGIRSAAGAKNAQGRDHSVRPVAPPE